MIRHGFIFEDVDGSLEKFASKPCWKILFRTQDDQKIELIEKFNYKHISKSPAVFDYTKLKWLNGEYFKAMSDEDFYKRALPYIKDVIHKDKDFEKIAKMVRTRIEIFPDIKDHIDFFESMPEYDIDMYNNKKSKCNPEISLLILKEILPVLEEVDDFTNDTLFAKLSEYAKEKEYKTGLVMWPIRTAVSGKQMTPGGATELMEILGKKETIDRIKKAIEKLG